MPKKIISDIHRGRRNVLPKVGVIGQPVFHKDRARILPKGGPARPPLISQFVTVSWAWTDQSQGNISWTFVNSDPKNSHAVVLYRNSSYLWRRVLADLSRAGRYRVSYVGWNAADTDGDR